MGGATAARLIEMKADVTILDLPSSAESGRPPVRGARFVGGDVTVEEDVRRSLEAMGPPRAVVNCAGIASGGRILGPEGPLLLEEFREVIEVNLTGTFNVMRLAAARMEELDLVDGERGVIVNTASIAAYEGQIGQIAYAASKAGVAGMTLCAARDLASRKIRVVGIAPGMFDTPMAASLPGEVGTAIVNATPHPARLGRPAEFAALVVQILENPMLNGTTIRLDAALRLPPR